ncbi:MAG: DMT family transporter [Deltaproteobacteria bacterium]
MTRIQADLLLLFAAALWGVAFFFQKEAMSHIGPWTFIAGRSWLAVLALAPLIRLDSRQGGTEGMAPGLARLAFLCGLAFLAAAFLQQKGLTTASVTNTGFLTSLYVVFTPLVGWILIRSRPPRMVWPAIGLSFAGTWLLGGGMLGGLGTGDYLIIAGSLFWATHCVLSAMASRLGRPLTFTVVQFATVAALSTGAAVVLEHPSPGALQAAAIPILFVGLVSTAFTFTIFIIAMRHTTPQEAAVLLSAESLFAAAAGSILLDERLSSIAWTGAALMTASVLLVQLGPRLGRRLSRAGA